MITRRFLTGLLLGAPIVAALAVVVVVTNIVGTTGSLRGQIQAGDDSSFPGGGAETFSSSGDSSDPPTPPPPTPSGSSASSAPSSTSGDVCTPICGDKRIVGLEECDDGNTKNGDGCSSTCTLTHADCRDKQCTDVAGSGKNLCSATDQCINKHAECNDKKQCIAVDGAGDDTCKDDKDCRPSSSSSSSGKSSSKSSSSGKESSSSSSLCADCIPDGCGDGDKQIFLQEECDDGNVKDGDGCSKQCRIEKTRCPADPCGPGSGPGTGNYYCAKKGGACVKDLKKTSCITCTGNPVCAGNECEIGGAAFCGKLPGKKGCVYTGVDVCIDCKSLCTGSECGPAGQAVCANYGKSCKLDPAADACMQCVPETPIQCTGTDHECTLFGSQLCAGNERCVPTNDGICVKCVPKELCTGNECDRGGDAYCGLVLPGSTCDETGTGLCIECKGKTSRVCSGTECRTAGGAKICGDRGMGCRNISTAPCSQCVPEPECVSDLQCALGAKCVNGTCVNLCGNGRLDKGEACDASAGGAGEGCTSGCLLDQTQQCTRDTQCASGTCRRNVCVPCTTGGQCQSNDCREGACTNLCGNGVLDLGELCDPGQEGSAGRCTADCLRPVNATCVQSAECQTGLCGQGACTTCSRNNQCGSGLCVSGECVDICGNGRVDAGEQCDDGNRIMGDGCSRFCEREARVAGEVLPLGWVAGSPLPGGSALPAATSPLVGDVTQGGVDAQRMNEDGTRSIATAHPAAGQTGPAALVAIATGAAAGWSYMRRRRRP